MPPSLRTLLERHELRLRLLSDEAELAPGALDEPVQWVHSSDLIDPTPFLDEQQLLLTTGTQFEAGHDDPRTADDYVGRLRARRLTGVGFGNEVIRSGPPESLIAACRRHGIPLFEVPYRTPFIAVARANADLIAEETYAGRTWALSAQRAISLAALRPDGLGATLAELSRQLECWVGLVDGAGVLVREFPVEGVDDAARGVVREQAVALLRRGQRASAPTVSGELHFTLQTLGRRGRLRGVLAIGAAQELNRAGREIVTSVIALAGLALEQNHDLDRARGLLRTGLLHALLGGDAALAQRIAAEMWGRLPEPPLLVAVAGMPREGSDVLSELLELRVEERRGALFFARDGDSLVLLLDPADTTVLDELVRDFGLRIGVATAREIESLPAVHRQGLLCMEHTAGDGPGVARFEDLTSRGVLSLLTGANVQEVARATLAPVADHDAAQGTELLATLRTWLENDGRFDATAQTLGVHRHTVRSRISLAERLLGRELTSFHSRADLWAALITWPMNTEHGQ